MPPYERQTLSVDFPNGSATKSGKLFQLRGSLSDLTRLESHFRFGENWASFSLAIDERKIALARKELAKLLQTDDLRGRSFLDIGSGSGLHSLAALQLGASHVTAIDIDPDSVATTAKLLAAAHPTKNWTVIEKSVFETRDLGKFDIVYSWGVLHHTGDMHKAIVAATACVAPNGILCIALYAKTLSCSFWRLEKRFYAKASKPVQKALAFVFIQWTRLVGTLALLRHGRLFSMKERILAHSYRGMQFHTDVHDWLGGYPYESIDPPSLRAFMGSLHFHEVHCILVPGRRTGLLGSGCDEYVFQRDS